MRGFSLLFTLCVALYLAFATSQVAANTKCTICKTLVEAIKDKVKDYEGKIDDAFKKAVCSKFGKFQDICDGYVDEYGPVVIEQLLSKVQPEAVCEKLNFCADDKWIRSLMTQDKAIDMYISVLNTNSMSGRVAFSNQIVSCEMCEFAVEVLEQQLQQKSPQVVAFLEKQCQRLPSSYRGFCLNIVDNYAPQLIDMIARYPPAEACGRVGLCKSKARVAAAEPQAQQPAKQPEVQQPAPLKSGQCALCQFVIHEAEKFIGDNRTETKIKQALEKTCGFLPGGYKTQCQAFVQQYADVLVDMIIQKFPPQKVCAMIGMCAAKTAAVAAPAAAATADGSNDTPCTMCQLIMFAAQKYISQNTTEDQIKKALYKACGIMPGDYAKTCDAFVDAYLDQLIEMLKSKYPPKVICQAIGVCPKAAAAAAPAPVAPVAVEKFNTVPSNDNCFLCQMAMAELYKKLNDSDTEQQIATKLEQVCQFLPGQFGTQCKALIENYVPFIIHYVENKYTPKQICQLLGQCAASIVEKAAPVKDESNSYCSLCLNVVTQVELSLQDGATRQQVKQVLQAVCAKLPGAWTAPCDMFVEYFADKLIDMILAKEPPSVICAQLGMCKSTSGCASGVKASTQLRGLRMMATKGRF